MVHKKTRFAVKSPKSHVICHLKSELCPPKFLVKSPEMQSYVARNFIMLKNTLASLLHIDRACFVSSKMIEQDIITHL